MLQTFTVTANASGVVSGLLAADHPARETAVACRIATDAGASVEVRLPVPGRVVTRSVADGARVAEGDALLVLAPDPQHALNAAAGLYLVGTPEDLELLAVATSPQSGFGPSVQAAAQRAIDAIRARSK
jgi:multidrug efflux pump subunit AcrA (membrane-fusion protein)